jgi:hypothetical protein
MYLNHQFINGQITLSHFSRLATVQGWGLLGLIYSTMLISSRPGPMPPSLRWQFSSATKGGDLYSIQAILKRLSLRELDITNKSVSTEGYQMQQPDVQFWVWVFLNCPPPPGVYEVPWRILIDVDEFGVLLEECNRTGG